MTKKIFAINKFLFLYFLLGVLIYVGGEIIHAQLQTKAVEIEFATSEQIFGTRSVIHVELPIDKTQIKNESLSRQPEIVPTPVIAQIYKREYQKAQNLRVAAVSFLIASLILSFSLVWFSIWQSWKRFTISYCFVGIVAYLYFLVQGVALDASSLPVIFLWPIYLRFIISCAGIPLMFSNC
ncbi:hypothetical protein A2690_01915 [Candidatus Roizmanbacteria bacterium RIFCSPHIGHO2_01_FULL_39_12b]|uniref:Uncharacterized protein n=1 Tax=Candidatus Roizmanbacteria bacterium RIFCSPHIGHO2_01_FULL_39_12b TaxID=1802030 RepID=A0A1F7GBL5_9BACT|nr:MAG: hypothetical protein A2690_01915 [Candidatus Roizmanbacteria bacterium RIFCSPHIGHO2_01_FULL_39_12b]OGK46178.1 MAG: hypothetical protein A3B46_03160 [Candidatus Roizmanbacteria bacterium RIFCSPLOWO2_01_FULL_39_19]